MLGAMLNVSYILSNLTPCVCVAGGWGGRGFSHLQLCNPMDYSPLGFSIHEFLQARILEWVAVLFSRGSFLTQGSNPGPLHCRQIL